MIWLTYHHHGEYLAASQIAIGITLRHVGERFVMGSEQSREKRGMGEKGRERRECSIIRMEGCAQAKERITCKAEILKRGAGIETNRIVPVPYYSKEGTVILAFSISSSQDNSS